MQQLYDIVIDGFRDDAPSPAQGLMRVFGIDAETAQQIVRHAPLVVKHNVSIESAQPYEKALLAIGAQVWLRRQAPAGEKPQSSVLPPMPSASTLNDAPHRVRPHAQIETALMHGRGWEPYANLSPHPQASLPPPPMMPASAPPMMPASAPPMMPSLAPPPMPVSSRSDRPRPIPSERPRGVVAAGVQLFEQPPVSAALEFADDVKLPEQGFRPISSNPPPPDIDRNARTTRFAASLELPWVGNAPEPPRKPSPSQRPPRDRR